MQLPAPSWVVVAAWLAVDLTVLKLDEYMSLDEFEKELASFIDEDKAARGQQLEDALLARAVVVDAANRKTLEDFTLRQVSDPDLAKTCRKVEFFSPNTEGSGIIWQPEIRRRSQRSGTGSPSC